LETPSLGNMSKTAKMMAIRETDADESEDEMDRFEFQTHP